MYPLAAAILPAGAADPSPAKSAGFRMTSVLQ